MDRDLASLYMEVVPMAMREFRKDMRCNRGATLTIPQYRILAQLFEEQANNRELSEQLGVSVAAMSRMVDGLSERGLVERKTHPGDRRMVKVQLTRKGRDHFAKFRKEARERLQKRLATLSAPARRELDRGLTALADAIQQIGRSI